ncbi:MAG: monooxygenase [Geminicoccales bacterium]
MSTLKLWDLHMTYDGPVTEEFQQETRRLAESIAKEPGVIWKIWTQEAGTTHFGSTYLFKDIDALETYRAMHVKRLTDMGITITSEFAFDIMEDLSRINSAPLGEGA